jgi:hypothetical protein
VKGLKGFWNGVICGIFVFAPLFLKKWKEKDVIGVKDSER